MGIANEDDQSLSPTERTFTILSAVASRPGGISFGALEDSCAAIPRSTLARLLKSLMKDGFLDQNGDGTGLYRLGSRTKAFARVVLAKQDVAGLIQPVLDEAATATQESVAYFELERGGARVVAKSEMAESFKYMAVGGCNPQPDHIAWLAVLYRTNESQSKRILDANPMTDRESTTEILKRLQHLRKHGFVRAVAVMSSNGSRPYGVVGISPTAKQERREHWYPLLRQAADEIGHILDVNGIEPKPVPGDTGGAFQ